MVGARRIRSKKLRGHECREGYARYLEGEGGEWNGDNNVEHMWEMEIQPMVESAREICGSVRDGGKNPKSVWWNEEIKSAVTKKETVWKGVLAASD